MKLTTFNVYLPLVVQTSSTQVRDQPGCFARLRLPPGQLPGQGSEVNPLELKAALLSEPVALGETPAFPPRNGLQVYYCPTVLTL